MITAIFVIYFLVHAIRMKGLLLNIDENMCSNAEISKYFAAVARRNHPSLWWHSLLLVYLVAISAFDLIYFRRFKQALGRVETASQREEKVLA